MKVFKGYMLIIKRNIGLIIQYVAIFMLITVLINSAVGDTNSQAFEASAVAVAVIDLDGGAIAKEFTTYLDARQKVTVMENDKSILQEKMFYEGISYVVTIPENFEEKCLVDGEKIQVTKRPGEYSGSYVDQQISQYMHLMRTYKSAGFTTQEAAEFVLEQSKKETNITLIDKNGNGGEWKSHIWMFQYFPYLYLSIFCYCVGAVILHFRKKEVKRRIQCSPIPLGRRNGETVLAYVTMGMGIWLLSMLLPLIYYGKAFLNDPHLLYLIGNSLVMTLVALSIAMITGFAAKSFNSINMIANIISLGLCFIGGVFVPISMMGDGMKKISQFLPSYWYVYNNSIFGEYAVFTPELKAEIFKGYGIQLGFAITCVCIALVISKMKEQEKG